MAGVDIVLADKPYVVDVNPRPTTSLIGITRVMKVQIADLILKSAFGELPQNVEVKGVSSHLKRMNYLGFRQRPEVNSPRIVLNQ